MSPGHSLPLVSVFLFCKEASRSVERCVNSVLNQSYSRIEIIVQDGASRDGTLEILQSFGDRIKLVSEPDSGPHEGFWRALWRCRGDVIGSCLADEELMPDAVERAVARFSAQPDLGAVTGDALATDMDGEVIKQVRGCSFNLVDYLFGSYSPYFSTSFFSRSALENVLTSGAEPIREALEFEIWVRLATEYKIDYVPGVVSKYAWHSDQLSNRPRAVLAHLDARLQVVRRLFSEDGFFGGDGALETLCALNQCDLFLNHLRARREDHGVAEILARKDAIKGVGDIDYTAYRSADETIAGLWSRMAYGTPPAIRDALPPALTAAANKVFKAVLRPAFLAVGAAKSNDSATLGGKLYNDTAIRFEQRGQIDQALLHWRAARPMNDARIESLTGQAMLKSPMATDQDQREFQKGWADRHALPARPLPPRLHPNDQRIRVGYVGSVWHSPYMLHQVLPFVAAHDRSAFQVFGYSGMKEGSDIARRFDTFRYVGNLADDAFVETVRSDGIDILVELNGFSPGHRFAALAARCAPVQISYVNHNGTSGVPNVDYVLADAISAPPELDALYTEHIIRLPGCFVCFDFSGSETPAPAVPPFRNNGFVTLGCFGSGGKINDRVIDTWAKLLNAVPDSRLILQNAGLTPPDNRRFMEARFHRCGIPPQRLSLLGGTDWATIMGSYAEIDISLDTWPYCGGNTIAESLWQGVPVITMKGDRFSARYGASIVAAAGLQETVAENLDEYVERAVTLAHDTERLISYRQNLRRMMKENGLSDVPAFAQRLEDAYKEMVAKAT